MKSLFSHRRTELALLIMGWTGLLPSAVVGQSLALAQSNAVSGVLEGAGEINNSMQAAVTAGLLASGSFQIVRDQNERISAIAGFQKRVRDLGISATFQHCKTIGLLSGVSADSFHAYGGACEIKVGDKPVRGYIICDDNMGPVALVQPDAFSYDSEYIELAMRRICA